ncbi:MAG TPA: hypothetical protein VFC00_30560 [Micromonosporaceae bacterium]|nr:hypothetical protein [Micromonosporaceae bacterium]
MLAVTAAALATVATPTVAVANEEPDERNCVQEFEEAQRLDMESFRDFDRETWRLTHDEDAITRLPTA